jgi:tRNA-Thr(GGU) m(6)t(6)A37 methyltransferase TsaA
MAGVEFNPIGVIHSPYKSKEQCPIQPLYASEAEGRVEVFEQYAEGLKDIESFSHIYLLYFFDRGGEVRLVRATFLDDHPHGIFASRHPGRPNGIGISIVKLVRRDGNVLVVKGIDILDGTPLLDIKPYIPRFDAIESASNGWVQDKEWRPKPEGSE